MNTYYTYVHRRNDTGEVFYVGKGKNRRAWSRANRNAHWRNIVAKHGYTISIVAAGLTEADAHRQEKRLIKLYNREHLANLTDGGEGNSGYVPSAETRLLLSRINMGKKLAPEGIKKTADALRGRKHTPERIAKLVKYLTGRKRGPMSEEQKEKIRQANKGRKHSAEHIRKQIASQSKPICGSGGVKFPSLRVAVEWLRANGYPAASEGNVSGACHGKQEMAYGRTWWYA